MKITNTFPVAIIIMFTSLAACNNTSTNTSNTITDSITNNKTTTDSATNNAKSMLDKKNFETTADGKQTDLYILQNYSGMKAAITNYGGRLVSLMVPDKNGTKTDVVVGFKSLQDFQNSTESYLLKRTAINAPLIFRCCKLAFHYPVSL